MLSVIRITRNFSKSETFQAKINLSSQNLMKTDFATGLVRRKIKPTVWTIRFKEFFTKEQFLMFRHACEISGKHLFSESFPTVLVKRKTTI